MSVLSIVYSILSPPPSLLYILLRIEKMASIDILYLYVSPSRNSPGYPVKPNTDSDLSQLLV